MSVATRQRTREIGVRLALGASPREITRLVVKKGLVLGVLGLATGLTMSLIAARWLRGQLFGVAQADLVTLAAVTVLVLGVSVAACYGPARRATRVDPLTALRD